MPLLFRALSDRFAATTAVKRAWESSSYWLAAYPSDLVYDLTEIDSSVKLDGLASAKSDNSSATGRRTGSIKRLRSKEGWKKV
jgi:hypothetical protein